MAYGTRTVPRVDKIVGPGNRWVSAAKSLVDGRLRHRLLRRSDRDPDRREQDPAGVGCRRPDRAGRARPRRARRVHLDQPRAWHRRIATEVARSCPRTDRPRRRCGSTAASSWPTSMNEAVALANACASEHLVVETDDDRRAHRQRRRGLRRPLDGAGRRRLRHRIRTTCCPPPGAARYPRRPERRRLREAGLRPARRPNGACAPIAGTITTLARAEGLEGHARSIEARTGGRRSLRLEAWGLRRRVGTLESRRSRESGVGTGKTGSD